MSNETVEQTAPVTPLKKEKGPDGREVADKIMTEAEKRKAYKQFIEQRNNSVIEAEINARYWKAQYEVKYYTLEENKLRTEYAALLTEKQQVLDQVDAIVEDVVKKEDEAITEQAANPAQSN